jgi:hypothetical protein
MSNAYPTRLSHTSAVTVLGTTIMDAEGLRYVTPDGTVLWCECREVVCPPDNPSCPMHSRSEG